MLRIFAARGKRLAETAVAQFTSERGLSSIRSGWIV
jgi:hypothetical protein